MNSDINKKRMSNKKTLITVATATLALVAATNIVNVKENVKAATIDANNQQVKAKEVSDSTIQSKTGQNTVTKNLVDNVKDQQIEDQKHDISVTLDNKKSIKAINNLRLKNSSVNSDIEKHIQSSNLTSQKNVALSNNEKNKQSKLSVNNDVKKEIYINQYTVPTGIDQNGNYTDFNRIRNNKDDKPATITVKLHNNGKSSYNTYGSDDTYIDSSTFNIPTTFDGYEYDNNFTKQYDPARYLLANDNGKIKLDKIADQQSYAVFYRTPDQILNKKRTLNLDELNKNNSYDSRFDWYDQDTGYYLGSTDMNDYSMGVEGHLFDDNLNIPANLRNNTDFVVKAPTGYRFMVVTKDGKLVTNKNLFTKNEFTAVNEFNYDDPMSGHHPYLDLSYSNDLYHEGVFHANEWAHIQQFDPTEPQNYCAKNLHIFKVFVRYEGKISNDKEPMNGDYPSQEAKQLKNAKKNFNVNYNQLIDNNIKSNTTTPNYRQVTIAVNDDLTGKNLGLAVIPIDITQGDKDIPLLQLKDYVTGNSILDSSYGISTWQNIDNQLTIKGNNVDGNKVHVGNYYVDEVFNQSDNHVDHWGNGRLQLWVHKCTQWDTPVSDANVSFVTNPKMKVLEFVDQNGQIVDWATKRLYGVYDTTYGKNVVDWNVKVPQGYSWANGQYIPEKYTFTSKDVNKYTKNGQVSVDNNPIIIKVVKHKNSNADTYNPVVKNINITNVSTLPAAWSIIDNISQLPKNTSYFWDDTRKITEDSQQVGVHTEYIKVTYPDGSFDQAPFTLNVKLADSKKNTPVGRDVVMTAGENLPAAWSLITNIGVMPAGTGYDWENGNQVLADSKKSGKYTEYVKVTYSDGSYSLVKFNMKINSAASAAAKYTPVAKSATMTAGEGLMAAWKLITNLGMMPAGASYDWSDVDKITKDSKEAGTYTEYVKVTYVDGSSNTAGFTLTVNAKNSDASRYVPVAKAVTLTAGEGLPAAWSLITNIGRMPAGTGYNWDNVDQVTKDSKKAGKYTEYVKLTYPDGSVSRQSFILTVNSQNSEAVKYTPVAKSATMTAGEGLMAAWKLITNLGMMPAGASYDWSDVDKITKDSKEAGTYTEYVKVTYADNSVSLVPFTLVVR